MATRSSSNRGVSPNSTNGSSYSTGRNPGGTQAVKRIPGVTYGEQEELTEMQKMSPLPKDEIPKRSGAKRPLKPVDVFAETIIEEQPITDGAPIGPGRMGETLTPAQRGDLFMKALAEAFPTSDTLFLAEEGLAQFEPGLNE